MDRKKLNFIAKGCNIKILCYNTQEKRINYEKKDTGKTYTSIYKE